jgi:hypothetical protein
MAAILRDAVLRTAPQDEVGRCCVSHSVRLVSRNPSARAQSAIRFSLDTAIVMTITEKLIVLAAVNLRLPCNDEGGATAGREDVLAGDSFKMNTSTHSR